MMSKGVDDTSMSNVKPGSRAIPDQHDSEGNDGNTPNVPNPGKATSSGPKYKKAPDAPKRFKSAFIIFSAEKHKEIKEDLARQGRSEKTTDIAKLVSEAWREMPAAEKEIWEKRARKDKARYEVEKAMYKGPWKIPANKRTPKDPSAPKRPMSAFLAFSNKRRAALKREHPNATNADLSKMLSRSWKEAPDDVRSKYTEEEASLRSHYKTEMGKWRKKMADEKKMERQEREAIAMEAAETRQPLEGNVASMSMPASDPRQFSRPGVDHGMSGPQVDHQQPHESLGPPGPPGPGGMYGNPYGMGGGQLGEYGGYGTMPHPNGHMGYGNMQSANPFGSQPLMGGQSHFMSHLFNQQFKPPSYPGQRGGMGMHGQGPGMPPGYGTYGMNDMPPHPPRGMMDGVHAQHMGPVGGVGPGGYRPPMSNDHMGHGNMGNMHDMMGSHYSRDMLKKEDQHHYGSRM